MPKEGYKTVTVTQRTYDILQRLKEQIVAFTQNSPNEISFNDIITVAVKEEDIYSMILERAVKEFAKKRDMHV